MATRIDPQAKGKPAQPGRPHARRPRFPHRLMATGLGRLRRLSRFIARFPSVARDGGGRSLAFAGPGYLVAVGYMDPGNWATDLAGGSKFGYTLLSVILDLQPDGDPAAGTRLEARHRHRTRSRAGVPRPLLEARRRSALDRVRDRHRRVRSGRGHRLGHRAQSAVPHSDADRNHHHRC